MKLSDITAPSQTEALTLVFELAHPPEKIWRALTIPELMAEWLLPSTGFKPEVDTAFTFQAPPQENWDGLVHCRLLAIHAPRLLRYSWCVGDLNTQVTFTLEPDGTGTRLVLDHAGFGRDQNRNFAGARHGWKAMGQKLADLLDEQD
ncbi:activator of hsp90 ATPase 1 family protein [Alcanivorax hongdengensis A-11-3]|uniref:Activator of hsp90 ATPase 1 family protein n=1 Tax=Alcanivorax hongdengensis A-11-3 TaxID=1177179 RepID=L0WH69_9GAMM|nr:SRPBCC domain-containing protein [Alcanivorax hongdengensis]EKF76064.1 activator of hsp90 ATPase 1 family protein [Alcanivorax hongdengensis A-11-3]